VQQHSIAYIVGNKIELIALSRLPRAAGGDFAHENSLQGGTVYVCKIQRRTSSKLSYRVAGIYSRDEADAI
jgi:hypothetical protein